MNKNTRFWLWTAAALSIGCAVFLILMGLKENVAFFREPAELTNAQVGQRLRIGGLVKDGSVETQGTTTVFIVTDGEKDVTVTFTGILPDLFREGQGVVATGVLEKSDFFKAEEVLAKHDENYVPKELKGMGIE